MLVAFVAGGCSQDLLDGESDLVFLNDSRCDLPCGRRQGPSRQAGPSFWTASVGRRPRASTPGRVVERRSIR